MDIFRCSCAGYSDWNHIRREFTTAATRGSGHMEDSLIRENQGCQVLGMVETKDPGLMIIPGCRISRVDGGRL